MSPLWQLKSPAASAALRPHLPPPSPNANALVGTTISALAFSKDGAQLAVAASYTHDQGPGHPHPPDAVFIRAVADSDVRPKAPKAP